MITDWIAAHAPLIMLLAALLLCPLDLYMVHRAGQRKLREIDTAQLIQALVRSQQKCRCNWLIACDEHSKIFDKEGR